MNDTDDPVDRELRSLATDGWNDAAHQNRLEKELTQMHTTRFGPARRRRLRALTLGLLLLLIGGGATGGTYAWLTRAMHYSFEVRRGDEVISRPRVIVRRGQTASVTIGAEDDARSFTIMINFDGTTTLIGPPEYVLDVEVVEIEIDH